MREFRVAEESFSSELADMTETSFGQSSRSVNFFFNNKFSAENCVICIEDGKIVSQLHMLPVKIIDGDKEIPSHYIYAASTLPSYRKRGCMSGLVDYACKIAEYRGQKYSILTPAKDELFKFYRKCGYYRFHKVREILLTAEEMKEFKLSKEDVGLDYCRIKSIRKNYYNLDGELIWDDQSIKYAFEMNTNLGGKNIFDGDGYAISFLSNENIVEVLDIAWDGPNIENLLGNIYYKYNKRTGYNIKLPVRGKLFEGRGKVRSKGMIRPVCRKEKKDLMKFIMDKSSECPCMGFNFE